MLASTIGTSMSICPCRSTEHKKRLYFSLKILECLSQIEHIYVHTTCWGLCYVCLDMQRSKIAFNFRTACRQIVSLCILNYYSWSWQNLWLANDKSTSQQSTLCRPRDGASHLTCLHQKKFFLSFSTYVRKYLQTLTFHRMSMYVQIYTIRSKKKCWDAYGACITSYISFN